jgi:hypothetical protein
MDLYSCADIRRTRDAAGSVTQNSLERRRKGTKMHVTRAPGDHGFPAIRLNGKWLAGFGFRIGEEITVKAEDGRTTIAVKGDLQ